MISPKIKNNKGFVILFAVTISAMLLAIALGVANISLKEINFATSARNTNDAFFAADTGAECALYYDRLDIDRFAFSGSGPITCGTTTVTPTVSGDSSAWSHNFKIFELGSTLGSCVNVTISKNTSSFLTTVSSKGYNIGNPPLCDSTNTNRTEREIQVTYSSSSFPSLPSPVGSWALNDGSGTIATDSSGNVLNASFVGSPVWTTAGKSDGGISTSTNNYLTTVSSALLKPTSAITLSAWINANTSNESDKGIVSNWTTGSTGYMLYMASGKIVAYINGTSATSNTQISSTGTWYHVASVWDGSNIQIYINGVADGPPVSFSAPSTTDNGVLEIGTYASRVGSVFDGKIDDVRIYNQALSALQVQALYNSAQ